jgi:hypothetical protein
VMTRKILPKKIRPAAIWMKSIYLYLLRSCIT